MQIDGAASNLFHFPRQKNCSLQPIYLSSASSLFSQLLTKNDGVVSRGEELSIPTPPPEALVMMKRDLFVNEEDFSLLIINLSIYRQLPYASAKN